GASFEQKEQAFGDRPPPRRFRWRVMPACLCWLLGGMMILLLPGAVYNNWEYLGIDFDQPLPWVLLDALKLAMFPMVAASGGALLYAGGRWMKGRWVAAIIFIVLPYGLIGWIEIAREFVMDWAINVP